MRRLPQAFSPVTPRCALALLGALSVPACDSDAEMNPDTDAASSSGGEAMGSTSGSSTATPPNTDTASPSTSGPGTSTTADPSDTEADGSSTGTIEPEQGIPVVVSIAHGGQTSRSCDGGQSWGDFHAFGIQDDHSDYAAFGGITFGNGAFVAATGWGAPAHILRSTDGATWEDIPDDAFVTSKGAQRPTNGASGVEFVNDGFVLFAGANLWRSEDGSTWTAESPPTLAYSGHFREVEYLAEPGLLLLATEDYESQGSWTIQVSADAGLTWQQGTGVSSECGGYVQHVGGFTASNGRLLLGGGSGPTCVSDDGGLTWSGAASVGAEIADVAAYDGGFVVLSQSGELFVSDDAQAWAPLGNTGLDGGRIAWDAELGFLGEGGAVYAHSSDGVDWAIAASQPPKGYVHVREFAIGRLVSCR